MPDVAQDSGRGAAFFDLDKTLIQGASGFHFAYAARQTGLMSRRQLAKDAYANLRYRLRGASDDQSETVRLRAAQALTGLRVRDLQRLSAIVMRRILPRIYPEILSIAYAHQDAGRPVYIVTATAEDLAVVLAQVLAFDGALGSNAGEVIDGHYTGRASGVYLYGAAKPVAIRALAEREHIDLSASYAYSDSISDLPMLEVVGHPVVVNPDAELRERAIAGGWEILHLDPIGRRLFGVTLLGTLVAAGVVTARVSNRRRLHSSAVRRHAVAAVISDSRRSLRRLWSGAPRERGATPYRRLPEPSLSIGRPVSGMLDRLSHQSTRA